MIDARPYDDSARAAVGSVVQNLVAARLGRGFVPVALLFVLGLVVASAPGGDVSSAAVVALGALASGCGMLLYGNGAVVRAFAGMPSRRAALQTVAGVVPYVFALYVLAVHGLRPIARASAPGALLLGFAFTAASSWLLWSLSRLTRLHRLARTMSSPAPEEEPGRGPGEGDGA